MQVIGISGKAHSGKDSTARLLLTALRQGGYSPFILHFAYPIKAVARTVFGLTDWYVNTEDGKASRPPSCFGFTVREILQKIGTEMFRDQVHKDIWIHSMRNRIENIRVGAFSMTDIGGPDSDAPVNPVVIIPDLRFDNEHELIREYGGTSISVIRPHVVSSAGNTHASELGLSRPVDFEIINDEGLRALGEKVFTEVYPFLLGKYEG